MIDILCTDTGVDGSNTYPGQSSDAVLSIGVSLASSFVGKVTTDDTVNTSDNNSTDNHGPGLASYLNITDWISFENRFRGWGRDYSLTPPGDFPSSENRGKCDGTYSNCRIFDWSLALADTGTIRDAITTLPAGADTLEHTWTVSPAPADQAACDAAVTGSVFIPGTGINGTASKCETTFLRNAVEIMGDHLGNENTLCESGETCLFTPNIGSYQGHGNLIQVGYIPVGATTLQDITLMQYEINGY